MSESEKTEHSRINFVAYLGHDLRSHLNAILGFSRLVHTRANLDEKHRDSLHKVLLSAEQLLQLINKVVDLAKLESDLLQLRAAPMSLADLLERIVQQYESVAADAELKLTKQWQELPSSVLADEVYLHQALCALVENAVKFTKQGEIIIAADYETPRFRFSVTDTGPGIEGERLQRLLADFAMTGDADGTGLGIAYCKALIELMGGSLEAVSTPGKGSTFGIELALPLSGEQADKTQSPHDSQAPNSPAHNIPGELREALHELIREGDILGILDVTDKLEAEPQFAEFAAELRSLAKNFQINKISGLLNAH